MRCGSPVSDNHGCGSQKLIHEPQGHGAALIWTYVQLSGCCETYNCAPSYVMERDI